MLACWDCRNVERFVQVSIRNDARDVSVTAAAGVTPGAFDRSDDRPAGLYCAACSKPVEGDLDALGLTDDRVDFMHPADFRADLLEAELRAVRPDATWTRLDLPAQAPRTADAPAGLHPLLLSALDRSGRLPMFTHQAAAVGLALDGRNVVQATPAGSGKSLGLTLPLLHRVLSNPSATGLLIFPLRALANDQLSALTRLGVDRDPWVSSSSFDLRLSEDAAPIRVSRYDGATPEYERKEVRDRARLIIATPDMLHYSILRKGTDRYRDGTSWRRFLSGLESVVLDELHTYQGVFGSNVSHVIRRLRRTVARDGQRPQFLCASATIGNPVELAERLTGVGPFDLVDEDGSGRAQRVVLVCNPPERSAAAVKAQETRKASGEPPGEAAENPIDPGQRGRIAPQTVAIELVATALTADDRLPIRTIVFARARNTVFQLAQRIRGAVKERRRGDLVETVAPYAATFTASDRIGAEGKLRDGSTLAVVSTSALELGIDIPDLSLAVLVGYPGQISSFRQRAGRAGRAGEGLAVLIVGDDPLQQWLARDASTLAELLDARPEDVVINPDAPQLARRFGLLPAQAEFGGVAFEDEEFFGPIVHDWLAHAAGPPDVEIGGRGYWMVDRNDEDAEPSYQNLRNASGEDTVNVFRVARGERELVGTIDRPSAPRDCFVPAIWSGPEGVLYRVIGFDHRIGEVQCEGPLESISYQTRGISIDRVAIRQEHVESQRRGDATLRYGVLEITRQVVGYKEQHFSGNERAGEIEKGWPPIDFVSDGLHIEVPATWVPEGIDVDGAIRAVEHVLLSVAPVLVACDPYDLDTSSDRTGVYLYDSFGGGLRLSEPVFERFGELTSLAYEIVATCPCDNGCPSCVMLSRRPDGNAGLSKAGAIAILDRLDA
jgi:DEAD/DEAH box helicase domain-containing protein